MGAQKHALGEQVTQNTRQHVNVELLVGPMILGAQRQVQGVFEMGEDRLNLRLPMVGIDDLPGGPVVPVSDENYPTKGLPLERLERGLVKFVGERKRRVLSFELEAQHLREPLAAAEPMLDVAQDSGAIALLPQAALGALILVSAASMIKPKDFRAIARIRRLELTWALATFAGVIVIGTLAGILVAVAISVLTLLYMAGHPPVYAVAFNRAKQIFRRAGDDPSDETFPGLLMLRTEGRIHFANAANVGAKMWALVEQTQPRVIVLEASATPDIEYTALGMLIEAERKLRASGVSLWLAGLNPDVRQTIERSSLVAAIGRERVYFTLRQALEAYRASADQPSSTTGESHADTPA